VITVAVHHDDLDGPRAVRPPQPVRDHGDHGLQEEVPPQDQHLHHDPGDQEQAGRRVLSGDAPRAVAAVAARAGIPPGGAPRDASTLTLWRRWLASVPRG
jgi:hypothetical protein